MRFAYLLLPRNRRADTQALALVGQRELRRNSVATWSWSQGALVASIATVPLFTRLLSTREYGLWLQLLSLATLAAIADLGVGSVLVRHLAGGGNDESDHLTAFAFTYYSAITALLCSILAVLVLMPGGLLAPFSQSTVRPVATSLLILLGIAVNLALTPYAVVLRARGQLHRERWYGAAPAIVGTLATVTAAALYHTAFAMAIAYVLIELGFDIGLAIRVPVRVAMGWVSRGIWRTFVSESWAVLVIDTTPQLAFTVDAAIIAHVRGAAMVAIYGAALKGGEVVRRFFSPLAESLFVSFCRSSGAEARQVRESAALLPWAIATCGGALAWLTVSMGSDLTQRLFGHAYGSAARPFALLLLAATVRGMLLPQIRRLQARGELRWLPGAIAGGFLIHVATAVALTHLWSITGTAGALLLTTATIEAPCLFLAVRQRARMHQDRRELRTLSMQLLSVIGMCGLAVVAVWLERQDLATRLTGGLFAASLGGAGAYILGRYYVMIGRAVHV